VTLEVSSPVPYRGVEARTLMKLTFEMPGDQDWDEGLWQRIGLGPEWDRLSAAWESLDVEVDDDEEVVLSFKKSRLPAVEKILEDARSGKYGQDVQTYWTLAQVRK
jgi:hypothetical protein